MTTTAFSEEILDRVSWKMPTSLGPTVVHVTKDHDVYATPPFEIKKKISPKSTGCVQVFGCDDGKPSKPP